MSAGEHPRSGDNQRGVALTEFALAAPIFFFVLLASFQVALVISQYYGVRNVARDTARWLAVNPDSTDASVRAHALAVLMPTMSTAAVTSVTASPACPALNAGRCTSRQPGGVVTVTVSYDLTSQLFLSPDFSLGPLNVRFPTSLPPYSVSEMIE